MSKETQVTVTLAPFTATGSEKAIEVDPAKWEDAEAYVAYCIKYANDVMLQRATAGKKDDPEKAEKALKARIVNIQKGVIPSGGGFTRLSDEDYAMKEVLTANKVKMEKGETIDQCLVRLAPVVGKDQLPELPESEGEEALSHEDVYGVEGYEDYAAAYDEALDAIVTELRKELEATDLYKSALKARKEKAKANAKKTGLLGNL